MVDSNPQALRAPKIHRTVENTGQTFSELPMSNEIRSCIEGEFNGFDEANVYCLENGQVYQRTAHHYHYHYAFRPRVRIFHNGSGLMLEVEGVQGAVPVAKVGCLEEGVVVSDFKGFNGDSVFQFENGHVWKQAEYKYSYHYAYRPEATVVDGINGPELHVEGPISCRRQVERSKVVTP